MVFSQRRIPLDFLATTFPSPQIQEPLVEKYVWDLGVGQESGNDAKPSGKNGWVTSDTPEQAGPA